MSSIKVCLGFDVGTYFIGVAVGNFVSRRATPLRGLEKVWGPDGSLSKSGRLVLQSLISEWEPDSFVVGRPLDPDGSRSWMTDLSEKYGALLEETYGIKSVFQQEYLSTVEARSSIFNRYGYRATRDKGKVDSWAAAIILEDYLRGA